MGSWWSSPVSPSPEFGLDQPFTGHVSLLGDSTVDNKAYTGVEPALTECIQHLVGHDEQVTLCARDGALAAAMKDQLAAMPDKTTHIVISVGGNDALGQVSLLKEKVTDVAAATHVLLKISREFECKLEKEIRRVVDEYGVSSEGVRRSIVVCSVYEPQFEHFGVVNVDQQAVKVAARLLALVVENIAFRLGLPVVDLQRVVTSPEHFANPIEPSSKGSQRMAMAIKEVWMKHNFNADPPYSAKYPQQPMQ